MSAKFAPLQLEVVTISGPFLKAMGVRWVKVALADGIAIGIWPGHAPLLAETVSAPLEYADARGVHEVLLRDGILHVEGGQVTIYTTPEAVGVEGDKSSEDDGDAAQT